MKRFIYAGYAAFLMGSIPIISIPQGTAWIGGSFVLWLMALSTCKDTKVWKEGRQVPHAKMIYKIALHRTMRSAILYVIYIIETEYLIRTSSSSSGSNGIRITL